MAPSTVTIDLAPWRDGGTALTLTHVGLPERQVAGHTNGWTGIIDQLQGLLQS